MTKPRDYIILTPPSQEERDLAHFTPALRPDPIIIAEIYMLDYEDSESRLACLYSAMNRLDLP